MCTTTVIDCNLNITTNFKLSEEEEAILNDIYFWIDGVLGSTIAVIGLIMNSIAIFILNTKEDMMHMSTCLLCGLLISGNTFLLAKLINIFYFDFNYKHLAVIIPYFVYPVEKTSLTIGVLTMVCLAHQGYSMINDIEKYDLISSCKKLRRKRIVNYMLPVSICAIVINIPRIFCYRLVNVGDYYELEKTEVRKNFHFVVMYDNFMCNILTVFAPITMILFFNWNIYMFIKEKRQEMEDWDMDTHIRKKNKTHADILFIIIVLFVICHFPKCFLKFYEVLYEPLWIEIIGSIERILLMVHASANTFIYMVKNDAFREHLYKIFRKIICCCKMQ